jgi:hypothetical protein
MGAEAGGSLPRREGKYCWEWGTRTTQHRLTMNGREYAENEKNGRIDTTCITNTIKNN